MNITELDEWQGLTSAMVQQWAEDHGYQYRVSGLVKGGYVSFANPKRPDAIVWLVPLLADRAKLSPQAFLREINPRMRKGMPIQAALAAHDHWLVRDTETGEVELHRVEDGHLYSMSVYRGGVRTPDANALPDFGTWMEFWPCDEHGNKVRWPTDAQGNML